MTKLKTSFIENEAGRYLGVNMLAIAHGRPETLNLKGILDHYLEFQYENTTRKYQALLDKELERKEIREGLIQACNVIDLTLPF